MEYNGRYLVNIRTKTIHDTLNSSNRCKLNIMQQKNAIFFNDLKDAENYPNKITPRTSKCKFCLK